MIFTTLFKLFKKMLATALLSFGAALVPVLACAVGPVQIRIQATGLSVANDIRSELAAMQPRAGEVSGQFYLRYVSLLKRIYSNRSDIPGWVAGRNLRSIALDMEIAIGDSYSDGLNPDDYHYDAIKRMLARHFSRLTSAEDSRDLARLELLLSDAFLQLSNDQVEGRLDRETLSRSKPGPKLKAVLADALKTVFAGALPQAVIEGLAPHDRDYRGMRAALSRYRRLAAGADPPPVPAGPALFEGVHGPRVKALVRRLESTGDMSTGDNTGVFDTQVAVALQRYQSRHGLRVDAIAGPATLAILNRPAAFWVDALRVNMERRRELPSILPSTRLVVNIANFSAIFFSEDKPRLTEKVIVGASSQETPPISSRIGYLVVNPSWEIPVSIARDEILPGARNDPGYFYKHPYKILKGWGSNAKQIDPAGVDWKTLTADRLPYHFLQPPGPSNPLGRVKFMFANLHDVYIHDTPAVSLFDARQRTFSHGCVRVENAVVLAAEILRSDGVSAPEQHLVEAMQGGGNQRIELPRPIPVYLVYRTAWAKDLNEVEFRPDVYRRDAGVLDALNAPVQLTSQ